MENHMGKLASERLEPGAVYTRGDLRSLFGIHDATLNNGIFRPKGYDSVWLFVTERKTPDRTQYVDTLTGDTLHMEGQLKGRTDTLILEHRKHHLELLVFHRQAKYEHPGAGFRYEGAFTYESHSSGNPTSFVLRRKHTADGDTITAKIERELDTQGVFNPGDISDARAHPGLDRSAARTASLQKATAEGLPRPLRRDGLYARADIGGRPHSPLPRR